MNTQISIAPSFPAQTDSLGCAASKLHDDRFLLGGGIKFLHKRSNDAELGYVETPPSDRGFLIGVARRGGHRRRIIHEHHASTHDFEANSVYVRGFSDTYRADMRGPLDFLLMEITPAVLAGAAEDAGAARSTNLASTTSARDPVLASLATLMMPALQRPAEAHSLFVDHIAGAMLAHLLAQYGGSARATQVKPRTLSRAHESRAKELLSSRLQEDVSIQAVADACNLSRNHFTFAFRETTGQTPYQWLLAQRVEKARALLSGSTMSLAEVAIACGFADQSHFTRVFAKLTGSPPGVWRRCI